MVKNIDRLLFANLRSLMNHLSDIILAIDNNGGIWEINKTAENTLGYMRSEMIGKPFSMIWLDKKIAQSRIQDALGEGVIFGDTARLVKKTGEHIVVSFTVSPVKDSAQRVAGAVFIAKDITEKKRMEKELAQTNLHLDSFVVHISHGLKSPLISLEGYIGKLEDRCRDRLDEKGYYYLAKLKKNMSEMRSLIQDLLDFYRTGMISGRPEPVDTRKILEQSIDDLKLEIEKHKVNLIVQDELPVLICHPECIHQIFSNLISNAIKFSDDSKQPEIIIGYKEQAEFHEFFVRDNGIGIDRQYHEKIFEIFQRLEQKRNVEGSGVGLALVKKAVEHHSGSVWVSSEPGKGATFYFTLPKVNHI